MTQASGDERAQFEEWARGCTWIKDVQRYPEDHQSWPGKYGHFDTERAWEVWQARAALEASLPLESIGPWIRRAAEDAAIAGGDERALKPCPFCGGEASTEANFGSEWWVQCKECNASHGAIDASPAEAETRWNRRAALEASAPLAVQLEPAALDSSSLTNAIHLIYFDDADRRPEIIQGERAARHRYGQISVAWNAHLFVKLDSNTRDEPFAKCNAALATTPAEPAPGVRDALEELVALKDLKDSLPPMGTWAAVDASGDRDDYLRRKPLAWAAARTALASTKEQT